MSVYVSRVYWGKHHGITFHSHLVGRCDVNDNKSLDSTSISIKLLKIFY